MKYTSLDVAEHLEIKHFYVLQKIRKMQEIKRGNFIKGNYTNSRNRKYTMYSMDKESYDILILYKKCRSTLGKSLENDFYKLLSDLLPKCKIIRNKKIGIYKVDFYLNDYKIIVEFDEKHHDYTKNKDLKREKEILGNIYNDWYDKKYNIEGYSFKEFLERKCIKIIRIKHNKIGAGLRELLSELLEIATTIESI